MEDKNLFVMKEDKIIIQNKTKNSKKLEIFKTILTLSLILIVFIELVIIIKQNIFIKYKLQKEIKYNNTKNIVNIKQYITNIENLKNIENKNNSEILNFKSYAQLLEDIILFLFLYDIKTGFYIDVGANDPIKGSVTNFFYIRGWNGINIEPLDNEFISLKNKRPRDINLNIAAGKEKGNTTLYMYKGLTTIMKNYSRPRMTQKIVNVETMADICKKYVPKGTVIEFCKIDVEGGERNVL